MKSQFNPNNVKVSFIFTIFLPLLLYFITKNILISISIFIGSALAIIIAYLLLYKTKDADKTRKIWLLIMPYFVFGFIIIELLIGLKEKNQIDIYMWSISFIVVLIYYFIFFLKKSKFNPFK
ncbi:hypothetical protein HN415_01100 [Candidatus Woesearchaeota archaeon]|jgi:peptidoglycan/LPS O-acetylase OafA/YrhL|nr:hypothetical protein [Candidatus Woesearchaeota archaeon]